MSTAKPMSNTRRAGIYHRQNGGESLLITPAQSRRLLTKAFRQLKLLGHFDG